MEIIPAAYRTHSPNAAFFTRNSPLHKRQLKVISTNYKKYFLFTIDISIDNMISSVSKFNFLDIPYTFLKLSEQEMSDFKK